LQVVRGDAFNLRVMRLPSPLFKVAPVVAASLDGRAGAVAGDSTGISRDVIVPTTLG
jgi:hypothetical protein